MEIWNDIKGFEELYKVSNLGEVKSLDRFVRCRNGHLRKISGKILIPSLQTSGYLTVNLWKNNICTTYLLHRLVAESFIPNPDNKPTVNHKNGDKTKNYVENLEWATYSENEQHAVNFGLTKNQRKTVSQNNVKYKAVPILQYSLNGDFIKEYISASEIHRTLGFNQGRISKVCRENTNKAYGYIWKYKDL